VLIAPPDAMPRVITVTRAIPLHKWRIHAQSQ
jgi:hypothetical protein